MTALWNDFMKLSGLASVHIDVQSGIAEMSESLLSILHLDTGAGPESLEQWFELWHAGDHDRLTELEAIIFNSRSASFSMTRRLYCGDGNYRPFRIDACITRSPDGSPLSVMGIETPVDSQPQPAAAQQDSGTASAAHAELHDTIDSALNEMAERGGSEFMPGRMTGLMMLMQTMRSDEIFIGTLGLTGSGKSAFINAMMGEHLLPEETRAATNLPVFCRRGAVRAADVFYTDGRIERICGSALTREWMESRTLERMNPGNRLGISRIEWSSPDAFFPRGMVLTDTPGFDVPNMQESWGGMMSRLLPSLDTVLYITPVRMPLKQADFDLIRTICDGGHSMTVLLSQTDLERDDNEAGRAILSRGEKISRAVDDIKACILREAGFEPAVIPISSKLAFDSRCTEEGAPVRTDDAGTSRASSKWRESNFSPVIAYMKSLCSNRRLCADAMRAARADSMLRAAEAEAMPEMSRAVKPYAEAASRIADGLRGSIPSPVFDMAGLDSPERGEKGEMSLISSLMQSLQEQTLQTEFLELPSLRDNRRILLLGLRRLDSLGLLARLAHDTALAAGLDREIGESEWIFSGTTPPPFRHRALPRVPLPGGIEFLIAPSDTLCTDSSVDWGELFETWTPIVHVDIARIDTGLFDLLRAPYAAALLRAKAWVIAFAGGGLFDTRLSALLTDVPAQVGSFISIHGYEAHPDWFIYENYDARYTSFFRLGRQDKMPLSQDDIRQIISEWENAGLVLSEPFTSENISWALELAGRAKRG